MTPAERQLAEAVLDPLAFATLSPNTVPNRYAPFHRQLTAWPTEPGTQQARIVYRGAAKTTLTRMMILWAIRFGHTKGVVYIRATAPDTAQDREAFENLAARYGMRCEVRNAEQLVIVNDVPLWTKSPRNPVRGLTHTLPDGSVIRPDIVIVDDVETEETSRSKTQTDQLQRTLFSAAFQTGDADHPVKVIMLGTPLSPTALISKAIRREPPFDTWAEPLVQPVINRDGTPAWPDKHDPGKQARTPSITWATEYMLETVPIDTVYFPPDRTIWRPTPKGQTVWVGVDPAGDGPDATGIAGVAMIPADDMSPFGGLHTVNATAWTGPAAQAPLQIARFVRELRDEGHTVGGVLFEANQGPWQFMVTETAQLLAPLRVQSEPPVISKSERALRFTLWHQHQQWSADPRLRGTTYDTELHTFTVDEQTVSGHDDVFDAAMWAAGVATGGPLVRPVITPDTVESSRMNA